MGLFIKLRAKKGQDVKADTPGIAEVTTSPSCSAMGNMDEVISEKIDDGPRFRAVSLNPCQGTIDRY